MFRILFLFSYNNLPVLFNVLLFSSAAHNLAHRHISRYVELFSPFQRKLYVLFFIPHKSSVMDWRSFCVWHLKMSGIVFSRIYLFFSSFCVVLKKFQSHCYKKLRYHKYILFFNDKKHSIEESTYYFFLYSTRVQTLRSPESIGL